MSLLEPPRPWGRVAARQVREANRRRVRPAKFDGHPIVNEASLNGRRGPPTFDLHNYPDRRPWAGLILGLTVPWPIPWEVGTACPVCGGMERLGAGTVCLACDRTWNEPPRILGARAAARETGDGLAGGTGKAEPRGARKAPSSPAGPSPASRARKPTTAARVAVRVLRAVLRYSAGDVVKLRPSQAASFIAAGCAEAATTNSCYPGLP